MESFVSTIKALETKHDLTLVKWLGNGDNGIAFETNKGTVLKFTLDEQEAILWNKVKDDDVPGLARCLNVWNVGSSIVYLVHAELLNNKLPPAIASKIKKAVEYADQNFDRSSGNTKIHSKLLIDGFKKVGLPDIAQTLSDLLDQGIRLYDLQPGNFGMDNQGNLKILDPSVPSMALANTVSAFESRLYKILLTLAG